MGVPIRGSNRNGSNNGRFSVGMKRYRCVGDVVGSSMAVPPSETGMTAGGGVEPIALKYSASAYLVWTKTIPSPAFRTDSKFSGYRGKSANPSYSNA